METTSNTSNSQSGRRSSHAGIGSVVKQLRYVVPMVLASIVLTSCLGSSSNDNTTHIRGINLVTDSPTLEFTIDTVDVSSASYGEMSPITAAHPGSHALQVAQIDPSNLVTQPQILYTAFGTPVTQNLAENFDYTLIAYGTVSDPKFLVTTDTDLENAVPQYTFVYQIIDASTKGPPLDIYITVPEAGIATAKKVGTLSFGESTPQEQLTIALPVGILNTSATLTANVTIELVNPATNAVVIQANTLTVNEQTRLLFVIADNIGPGATPVVIDALVGPTGAAATGIQFANLADDAELAFVNVTEDAPPYNIIGGLNLQSTLATNIGFGQKSAYGNVNAGVAGTIAAPTSDPTLLSFLVSFTSTPDQSYTEYAVGPLATISGVVLQDDRRTVPTQGEFRFLNAITSLQFGPNVDIYLTVYGAGLDILATNTNRVAPNYSDVAYKAATAYTQLAPGRYEAYFAYTGTSNIFLGPEVLQVDGSTITTYVLTNPKTEGVVLLPFNDGR